MRKNNKNSFVKKISDYEMLEFIFTHCDYYNSKYAYLSYRSYYHRETEIIFHCPCCQNGYELDKLHYRNGKVMCECGAVYDVNNVRPASTHGMYSSRRANAIIHNQSNGTINKFDVPTMIGQYRFYCNKCHKTHMLEKLSNKGDRLVCTCGEEYEFKDVKVILHEEGRQYMASNIYFDDNKISLSLVAYDWGINRHNQYYWQAGNKRLTMNLETGYSYATNKGGFYREFNQVWQRRHNSKAPVMYNTTYSAMATFDNECFENAKVQELITKYAEYPNLVRLICKNEHAIRQNFRIKQNKVISDYMTNYFNNKYSYEIKPLVSDKHMGRLNLIDFVTKNRFVNVSFNTSEKMQMFLSYLREEYDFDRKYTVFGRETNLPYMDWITKNINISKSLRKRLVKDFAEINHGNIYTLLDFVYIAKRFSNKENINKIYNLLIKEEDTFSSKSLIHYQGERDVIKYWLTLRDESYISNCKNYDEFIDKYYMLKDTMSMMMAIDKLFGENWTKGNVIFKTEKQYHDDVLEIYHSEAYKQAKEAKDREQLMKPFELEDETYALESNEITIARNRYELSTIGSAMHICVGSYGHDVERRNCRIAYIQENGEYKACLELRMETDDKTKKVLYKLVQAKLKHNALVRENSKYNNIIVEWCKENKIDIKTSDMINKIIEGECVVYDE